MVTNNLPPRQKMINLMYIVLTAMLALNVSSDVLDGFKQVEDGLNRSTRNASTQNAGIYEQFVSQYRTNPEKTKEWYNKATTVKKATDHLYLYIDTLKLRIVQKADGKKADINDIKRKDDLEAASYIMLSPVQDQGAHLHKMLDNYRAMVSKLISDPFRKKTIEDYLTTQAPAESAKSGKNWEEAMFENMPVSAAVTILSKIQSDLRYAESEVLHTLINNIDKTDVRVNQMTAFVIPNSKNIIRGGKYSANIVLAAIDSTQHPAIYINKQELSSEKNGLYESFCNSLGNFKLDGYIEVPRGDGSTERHPFSSEYSVIEPSATVSATLMNVLYAGINNPMSISVPGIPASAIQANMTNGSLQRGGKDGWIAKPVKIGQDAVITVSALMDGRQQTVATYKYRVRSLPDPMPYITYKDANGNERKFKGGAFSKGLLLDAPGIEAAIDDDLLNVTYRVTKFETIFFDSMGNAIPELSNGSNFSSRQKDNFRRLSRGKRFYISRVQAIGPDGIERTISPIEVIIN